MHNTDKKSEDNLKKIRAKCRKYKPQIKKDLFYRLFCITMKAKLNALQQVKHRGNNYVDKRYFLCWCK